MQVDANKRLTSLKVPAWHISDGHALRHRHCLRRTSSAAASASPMPLPRPQPDAEEDEPDPAVAPEPAEELLLVPDPDPAASTWNAMVMPAELPAGFIAGMVTLDVPVALGEPETIPVLASSTMPQGKAPLVMTDGFRLPPDPERLGTTVVAYAISPTL